MRILRRVNRIVLLIINIILIMFICVQFPPGIITFLLIPVLSILLEFISVLMIMSFKLEEIISYRAFGADEYELTHFKKKT